MKAVEWTGDSLRMLDQTRLPAEEVSMEAFAVEDVATAIGRLAIRGAPLLGVAAAHGMALAALRSTAAGTAELLADLERAGAVLVGSRPTGANIAWAVGRALAARR